MKTHFLLDPLTPYRACKMLHRPKKGGHMPGYSNFLKHKGGESRYFDYEILSYLGQTKTWDEWLDLATNIVESYPNYGKFGGKSAKISAARMLYGMRKEGFFLNT